MDAIKTKINFYRTRNISKDPLDVQSDDLQLSYKTDKIFLQTKSSKQTDTELKSIIDELKGNNKEQDILLMITPASKHVKSFKLHVIYWHNRSYLGWGTITEEELSHLKDSNEFQNYCIVLASRYVNLQQTEQLKNLLNCLDKTSTCDPLRHDPLKNLSISNTSYAGDYFKKETTKTMKFQDSFIQTEPPDEDECSAFSLSDVYTLMEKINCSLQPSQKDIKRFFFIADKLNVSIVVRPELLWKSTKMVNAKTENVENFLLESYLSGSSYLGCIALTENDFMPVFDLYPRLLSNIHVIEDVFEITPLPKNLVNTLKSVFGFLKLELMYDILGEYCFDWYKNFTYL